MSTRVRFGATGLQVSPVSFGTWQLSPRFWGPQDEAAVTAAMHAAFDHGINFFDTADAYGDGLGETVLGKFVSQIARHELVICTKLVNHFNADGSRYPDTSPAHLTTRLEASLRRLRTDHVDLLLLHFFDQMTPFAEVTGALDRLVAQGKVRHYGVSNYNTEQFRAIRHFGPYNAHQPPYSLLDTAIENDLLPYCQAHDIGVMVYSPLHKGLLSGKYSGEETFGDFRANHPDFTGARFKDLCARVRALQPIAETMGMSIYQLVLSATLMHPAIPVAVVGIKTPEQIREAAAVMGKTLPRDAYFAVRNTLAAPARLKDATGKTK